MMPLDDAKSSQLAHLYRIVIKKYGEAQLKTLHLHSASCFLFFIFLRGNFISG